jgi:hypothetical protein
MALYTDRTEPRFIAANVEANSVRGWDLTIKLPLDDPAIRALSKANVVSLMTTGWTGATKLDPGQRKIIGDFLATCRLH